MENLKTKSALFYDNGNWVSMAQRLAKDFGQVQYFNTWKDAFPQVKRVAVGEGVPGIKKVYNFFDALKENDIIIFPDILDGDLQEHLRGLGYPVWGSGKGEQMELDRVGMLEWMKSEKLNVPDYEVVEGTDALRKYIKENENIWVKPVFRGDFETFNAKNYRYIETYLDELETILGVLKQHSIFLCQHALDDCVEIGYDGYTVNGKFPTKTMFGIEVKDMGYVGVAKDYKDLPQPLIDFNKKISPMMESFNYRGDYSNEMRIQRDGKWFMTDMTCRKPSPPGELFQKMVTNYSQIIWEGAHGNLIDPIMEDNYGVEVIMKSSWEGQHQIPVQFKEKYAENIQVKSCTFLNNQYTYLPQVIELEEIGSIVATGKTLEEAINNLEEISDEMRSYSVTIPLGSIDKAKEEIDKLTEFGYDVF